MPGQNQQQSPGVLRGAHVAPYAQVPTLVAAASAPDRAADSSHRSERHESQHLNHASVDDEGAEPSAAAEACASSATAAEAGAIHTRPRAAAQHLPGGSAAASSSTRCTPGGGALLIAAPLAAAGVALLVWLLKLGRSRAAGPRGASQPLQPAATASAAELAVEPPEPPAERAILASDFQLAPTAPAPTSGGGAPPPQPLLGLTLVVAETLPLAGAPIGRGGIPASASSDADAGDGATDAPPSPPPAADAAQSTSQLVLQLAALGVAVVGRASVDDLNYPGPGTQLRNPSARWRASGGGCSGGAAAVATGAAQLALGTDYLGSVRGPAAAMGLYSFLPTPGLLDVRAAHSSGDGGGGGALEAPGFIAARAELLCRLAGALGLPGPVNLRHELTQVVVAEDMFALCDAELAPGLTTAKRAVLFWAGQEQAGSVQLLTFLETNTRRWRALLVAAPGDENGGGDGGSEGGGGADGKKPPRVLLGLHWASTLLYQHALWSSYGRDLDGGSGSSNGGGMRGALAADAAAALAAGARVTDEQLAAAQAVASEVSEVLKGAVKKDVVVMVPILAGLPPRLDAAPEALAVAATRMQQFAALPALAGCPCVTLPVPSVGGGGEAPPLAVALFGPPRSDQRLLAVAAKLGGMMAAEAAALQQQQQQQEQEQVQGSSEAAGPAAANGGRAPAAGSARARGGGGRVRAGAPAAGARARSTTAAKASAAGAEAGAGGGRTAAAAATAAAPPPSSKTSEKALEKAEKHRSKGNELFKAGKYVEAVREYSRALALGPPNAHVLLSNRAMAHLKAFSFELAEADCESALRLLDGVPRGGSGGGSGSADRVKVLLRRGTARMHLYKMDAAVADFEAVLRLEPNNRQAREELRALRQQQQEMLAARRGAGAGAGDASAAAAAMSMGFPHGLMDAPPLGGGIPGGGGGGMNGLGSLGPAVGGGGSGADGDALAAFAEMAAAGGEVPVLLGRDGRRVTGPQGEPVFVGPGGQPMMLDMAAGRLVPLDGNGAAR